MRTGWGCPGSFGAKTVEDAILHIDRVATGGQQCKTTVGRIGTKCDDNRFQFALGNDQTIDKAAEHADPQGHGQPATGLSIASSPHRPRPSRNRPANRRDVQPAHNEDDGGRQRGNADQGNALAD